jgi:hypothetical protein
MGTRGHPGAHGTPSPHIQRFRERVDIQEHTTPRHGGPSVPGPPTHLCRLLFASLAFPAGVHPRIPCLYVHAWSQAPGDAVTGHAHHTNDFPIMIQSLIVVIILLPRPKADYNERGP